MRFLNAVFLTAAAAIVLGAPAASAGPLGDASTALKASTNVSIVHEAGARHRYRRYARSGPVIVDVPTTYVQTYNRRVWVDAPFTAVRVHPRGVWVRAPFVNIYVPR